MKKIIGFLSRSIFLIHFIFGNDVYQSIRVFNSTPEIIKIIAQTGIPLDHVSGKKGIYIDVTASQDQTIELISLGLDIDILIPDLTEHYLSRNIPDNSRDFSLGSMQGNYTWDELNSRFDELQAEYPNIISERVILGESVEGRDIWAFKVSDTPDEDEEEPEVLFTALTHAREPVGMMNLIYFVQLLAEEYGTDPELTYLVNEREIWFLPVVNPDGYVYNESIQPNGGGMHRKNRLNTNCGDGTNRGVDLNRNYGFGWGANNTGSSPDPCATTYRGESAFSEPETQVVRDFITDREFMNVIHYHTYSNVYIHAYGNATLPDEPDLTTHREIGNEMARYNGYPVGTGYELIGYTVNGDAVDWTYGDQGLVAFTPEVGSYTQGFWPSENDVLPLCEDQVHSNKVFAFVAGPDLVLQHSNLSLEEVNPGDELAIEMEIKNRGLTDLNDEIQINFSPMNGWTTLSNNSVTLSGLDARDSEEFSFDVLVSAETPNGTFAGVIFSIENESSYPRQDTVQFLVGQPETLFFDGFENGLVNWYVTGDWGLTDEAGTGSNALSDSPNGNYDEAQESFAEFEIDLDLSLYSSSVVEFIAKWEIESNYDFVRLQADVEGDGWVSLEGLYTEPGSGQLAQPAGEPGYDGTQEVWVEERIQLDQLGDAIIYGFRFIQTSDNAVEEDGFIVDDFSILGMPAFQIGDFNLDHSVDIMDVFGMTDLIISDENSTDLQLFFCDINESGDIDTVDILLLINIILKF